MSWLETSIEYEPSTASYRIQGLNDTTDTIEEKTFAPDSVDWFEWLASLHTFRFVGMQGTFTARLEQIIGRDKKQHGSQYWYAYRKLSGTQVKRYLAANSSKLSIDFLEESARIIEESLKEKLGIPDGESLPTGERTPKLTALQERIEAQEQTIAELNTQIETLRVYIGSLESQLQAIAAKREKRVGPKPDQKPPDGFVWLTDFARQHFVPYAEAERLYKMGMIHGQKISPSHGRAPIMIGPRGQRDFYVQLHVRSDYRTCDDCPHDEQEAKG